jgi:type IV secretory pathway protease TraF
VVQSHPYSFDSRYFGPVSECQIIGVAYPIWTWNRPE